MSMMSSSAGLKTLSVISNEMTSRALMIGMPARMNTPSWRLKCIRSRGLTFFLVISYWRMLFFSATWIGRRSRCASCRWTSPSVEASCVPAMRVPSRASAVKLYFGMRPEPFDLQRVDRADDFGQRGDVPVNEPHGLFLERAHPLRDCQPAELFLCGPSDDETLDLGGDVQQLVDADAILVAGVGAEVAAGAVPERVALGI